MQQLEHNNLDVDFLQWDSADDNFSQVSVARLKNVKQVLILHFVFARLQHVVESHYILVRLHLAQHRHLAKQPLRVNCVVKYVSNFFYRNSFACGFVFSAYDRAITAPSNLFLKLVLLAKGVGSGQHCLILGGLMRPAATRG